MPAPTGACRPSTEPTDGRTAQGPATTGGRLDDGSRPVGGWARGRRRRAERSAGACCDRARAGPPQGLSRLSSLRRTVGCGRDEAGLPVGGKDNRGGPELTVRGVYSSPPPGCSECPLTDRECHARGRSPRGRGGSEPDGTPVELAPPVNHCRAQRRSREAHVWQHHIKQSEWTDLAVAFICTCFPAQRQPSAPLPAASPRAQPPATLTRAPGLT